MHCPHCGAVMNRHAEKPLKLPEDVVLVIYTCPACGKIEARPSQRFA